MYMSITFFPQYSLYFLDFVSDIISLIPEIHSLEVSSYCVHVFVDSVLTNNVFHCHS